MNFNTDFLVQRSKLQGDPTSNPKKISTNSSPVDNSRTPTRTANDELKGKVETKIISWMHNLKYGWSGKMRSSFSKESAIWVLGRCYHRKMSPLPSMETSVEMSNILENKLTLASKEEQAISLQHEPYEATYEPNEEIEYPVEQAEEMGADGNDYEDGVDGFKKDFITRIWMTYRREFPIIVGDMNTNFTSDCGWGCMIRSGQMLLAQALVMHFLGRSWRYDPDSQVYTAEDHIHRKIIRWFGDQTSKNSPFSLHSLVTLGKDTGKRIGEWYGPNSVAHLLKQAVKEAAKENLDLASLHVYVAQDCAVYNQDILDECYTQENQSSLAPWQQHPRTPSVSPAHRGTIPKITTWKSLILLIPLRLGSEKLNPIYGDCLKAMLSLDYCIGIIGGRPKHSLYFIGYQDDKLIHLDPHYCQDNVDVNQDHFPLSTFHCKSPRKMKLSKMDPSCCLAFYIPTKNDYDKFQTSIQPYLLPLKNYSERQQQNSQITGCISQIPSYGLEYNYPMFVFCRGRSSDLQMELPQRISYRNFSPAMGSKNQHQVGSSDDDEDDGIEDFVVV